MKRLLIIFLLVSTLFAGPDWFGYYEGEGDLGQLRGASLYFGYNKLRLDMDTSPSDNIRISADIVCKRFNGQTELNFLDFLDAKFRPVLPSADGSGLDTLTEIPYSLRDTLFIDDMFLEFHHKYFDLTLGKQQIAPGVGYAWNPTDIFNLKDIMDPTYENTGISALRLSIPLANRLTVTGILQPRQTWDETVQYYQIKIGSGQYDLSALYGRSQYSQTGLFGAKIQTHDLYGFNLEGELFGWGIRSEVAVHRLNYANDHLKYEYVLGTDYTLENSLYLLAEFYHNDLGARENQTTLDDYLFYYSGERKSINRNYLFALAMYPLGDLLDFSLFGIINLDDRSAVVAPQLTYRIYQDVELSLLGSCFVGDRNDEFGYQNLGIRFRVRAYF